jgi:8-oxo-dGTP pyrophosphatase MutT (NUDIX family)
MPQERSAGVIVFKRDGRVAGGKLFLLLDYGKFWDFPKGHVERGEDDLTAALRELAEETGITDAQVIEGFGHEISYFFRNKGWKVVRKTVVFFLAETATRRIEISDEHVGGEFLPLERALERVTYKNAKETLRAANDYLEARAR